MAAAAWMTAMFVSGDPHWRPWEYLLLIGGFVLCESVVAVPAGYLADAGSRTRLIGLAAVLSVIGLSWMALAAGPLPLVIASLLVGISLGAGKSAVFAALGDDAGADRLAPALGFVNLLSLAGVATIFCLATSGNGFLWAGTAAVAILPAFFPRDPAPSRTAAESRPRADQTLWRRMAGLGTVTALGALVTLLHEAAKVWYGPVDVLLWLVVASLAALTLLLWVWPGWPYRRSLLYGAQLLVAGTLIASAWLPIRHFGLLLLPIAAFGAGLTSALSLYFALHGPSRHGAFAGAHQAALGAGLVAVPWLSAAIGEVAGEPRAGLLHAAALPVVAIAAQEVLRRRRSP